MTTSIFTFIVTHIDVTGILPIDLGSEHFFRRATDKEIAAIDDHFSKLSLAPHHSGMGIPYKEIIREEHHENNIRYFREELPKDRWKYWVIAHNGTNHLIEEFRIAAILIPIDIDFGSTFFFNQLNQQGEITGWSGMPLHLIDKYYQFAEGISNAKIVSIGQISEMRTIRKQINELSIEASFVKHAINNFNNIRSIPSGSELRVIGYMAIIESLITHAPRLTETLDSINHQMVHKMILLGKLFERKIDHRSYFREVTDEKLWKTLYSYRSCLAHGGVADFKNTFRILESHEKVVAFLKEIVKELILYGLVKHAFLADLKKC